MLLVSELVTNAVRHGGPPIELELSCDDAHALQVRDAGPGEPSPATADLDGEHGRGLAITSILSDAWGVEPTPPGKTVWFRLHYRHD